MPCLDSPNSKKAVRVMFLGDAGVDEGGPGSISTSPCSALQKIIQFSKGAVKADLLSIIHRH